MRLLKNASALVLRILIAMSILASQWIYADSGTLRLRRFQGKMHRVFIQNPQLYQIAKSGAIGSLSLSASSLKNVAGHYGQTILLIWILAGLEAYRQQARVQPVSEDQFDVKLLGQIFDTLINDASLVAGMAGAGAATFGLSKPLNDLQVMLQSQVSREFFKQLLINGAMSFVTFVGWEAGSQLWNEALFALDDKDYGRGQKLRFLSILGSLVPKSQALPKKNASFRERQIEDMKNYELFKESQDRELFFTVLWKGFEILTFQKPHLSKEWIYNTWRLRWATGEFLTLLTGMVTGGALAGSVVPGAGNVVGFFIGAAGGIAGGLATMMIPESWKASITKDIRYKRLAFNQKSMETYHDNIRNMGRHFKSLHNVNEPIPEIEQKIIEVRSIFNARYNSRNAALTPLFEEIYYWKVKLQEATTIHELVSDAFVARKLRTMDMEIAMTQNPHRIRLLKAQKQDYIQRLGDLRREANELIERAPLEIMRAFHQISLVMDSEIEAIHNLSSDQNVYFPDSFYEIFNAEAERLASVRDALELLSIGTVPQLFQGALGFTSEEMAENEKETYRVLNVAQSRGFDESWFY